MLVRIICFISFTALLVTGCDGGSSSSGSSGLSGLPNVPGVSEGDGSSNVPSKPDSPVDSTATLLPGNHAATRLPYSYQPNYVTLSGDVVYSAIDLPQWASLDPVTGLISGTPTNDDLNAYLPIQIGLSNSFERVVHDGYLVVEHGAAFRSNQAYDFYSRNYDGDKRSLRNDLRDGELQGEVQFLQSHSLAPNGNHQENKADQKQSRYMPRVTAQREALLLFLPEEGINPITVEVEVGEHGQPIQGLLQMMHPNDLPLAEKPTSLNIQYSTRAWSIRLPWDQVKNGLSLRFVMDRHAPSEKDGVLSAERIDISPASQLVFKSIRLGMLTHTDSTWGHFTLNDPVMAATDYFQTLPIAKLVMGSYADMQLRRVIIGNGRIYDMDDVDENNRKSGTSGNYYGGDMREAVAKSQVSVGINMADFGYTSHHMNQNYEHVFKQITNHHAWGMYSNGRQPHGLSGGNGIGTLVDSRGNEASHEWGHAYGLGHYPGQGLTDDGRWANHHADSGWGYVSYRQKMRSGITGVDGNKPTFNRDAMSGGHAGSPLSAYTYYTGFSARIIQNDIAQFPIPDTDFPTGYKKWSPELGAFQAVVTKHPKPEKVGVPIATILGGYDPLSNKAVIYPVFHGNYGNIFDLPVPDLVSGEKACWVEVSNASGQKKLISVKPVRHNNNSVNQLHFNLAAEFKPTLAELYCRDGDVDTLLTRTVFDGEIPSLPAVAIVGQEAGFQQLKQREMYEIENELIDLGFENLDQMSADLTLKIASYSDAELQAGLSSTWSWLEALRGYEQTARNITTSLGYSKKLGLSQAERLEQVTRSLLDDGLIEDESDLLLEGHAIHGNGLFFSTTGSAGGNVMLMPLPEDLSLADKWVMDGQGKLHSVLEPWLCLNDSIKLDSCSRSNAGQRWLYDETAKKIQKAPGGKCLDLNNSKKTLITYGCHGGGNQKWDGVERSKGLWLDYLEGDAIKEINSLMAR